MKIVLIGPVYPYKGGISHYTGMMCRSLRKRHDVSMVSYRLQYPKLLFKREQKDFANDTFKIEDTDYLINTADPFSWRAAAAKISALKPDLVIIQWWHPYFAPCYRSLVKRLKSTKVLFVCHNVFPHERFPMDRFLTRSVLKQGDLFLVHSAQDENDLRTIVPDARFERAFLPTYNAFKFQDMPRGEARRILGLGAERKILLFFGFVREYKGLKYLIRAVPEIRKKIGPVTLFIVGDFGGSREEYLRLIRETGAQDCIAVCDGYIPDREVEKYFAAADLVVLPYTSATQSAVVQVAYGFDKPVVATNVGGLPEVVLDEKTGYVVEPENPGAIADAVNRFFQENRAEEMIRNVKNESYKYSWDRMTEAVERLWKK